jgi:hypothetical protein
LPQSGAQGQARQSSQLDRPGPGPTVSGFGGSNLVDAVRRIDWFGDR